MALKIARILGYVAFFVTMFCFFLLACFPVERFTHAVEQQLTTKLGRKVSIGELSLSPFGSLRIENLEVEVPRPEGSVEEALDLLTEDKPGAGDPKTAPPPQLSYLIEEASIDIGLFDLLLGDLDVALSMEVFGGELEIAYEGPQPSPNEPRGALRPPSARAARRPPRPPSGGQAAQEDPAADEAETEEEDATSLALRVEASDISLKQIHDLRNKLPVPIAGLLDLDVELEAEDGQWSSADGELTMTLRDAVLSSKGYKADIGGMQMEVPALAIASAELHMVFTAGVGEVKSFKMVSKHFDAKAEGSITLGERPELTRFDMYFMFKVLEAYVQQSDALKTILPSLDTFSTSARRAHRPDGYYGFRFRGPWKNAAFQPSASFNSAKTAGRERPTRERRASSRSSRSPMSGGDLENGQAVTPPFRPGRMEAAPSPDETMPPPSYESPSKDEMPPGIMQPPMMPPPETPPEPVEEPQVEEPQAEEAPAEEAPNEEAPAEEAPAEEEAAE